MNKKRRPDYEALYPNVKIAPEILGYLKKSDRRMEYFERDLKRDRAKQDSHGRVLRDVDGQTMKLPEREVSLEKMMEEDWEFPADSPTPEEELVSKSEKQILFQALESLTLDERDLINALYFGDLTDNM